MSWASVLLSLSALLASGSADAPAYEIELADVSTAPDACPARDQLAEALEARMPGVVARGAHEPGPGLLRLGLTLSSEGVARVTMTDATGALRLERELDLPKSGAPGAPRERAGSCGVIAETVALIVERYMRHIGYHEPPPPELVESAKAALPPPPRPSDPEQPGGPARLGLGVGARPPYGAPWRFEAWLTGAIRLGRFDLAAGAGASLPVDEGVPQSSGRGMLTLHVFPARLSVGWTVPLGTRLSLVPAIGGGFDLVFAQTRGIDVTRRSTAVEPTVEVGLRAVLTLTRRVWLGAEAFQGIDVRPEEFSVKLTAGGADETVFMTPRHYTRVGVDFGVYLGKN